ncbi:LysR family transcriptional regulator [Stenotrophobium rhamnosiphilum]|uniref:LysR family transcriptional regulator n=1 Tax=Stenotrophobium rhamnosiphilum TaxID=2029166 RepID=A0A2T5ME83_9GAMM|nr:LysR family transcriptional regulator [Stenotrophobium rhamnosiphilum]PTU30885.1 LysR family transcriptional regulator [Stenotrophobium rhamnosiphilum]
MDRWHAMKVFLRVADGGGFAEAARQLNMSAPAVTRAIAALEETIGARLFIRTTRAVKLTDAGSRYLLDCRRILADIEEAEAAAAGAFARPSGTLTVTAPVLFGQMYVMPLLTEYLKNNPAVTGRALFFDRITNIVDEGIDAAIRIGHLPDSGLSAIGVGSVRRVICGSHDYFAKHGVPSHPADLANHSLVAVTSAWNSLEWRFGRESDIAVSVNPQLFCNTNEAAISTALDGWGLTRVLSYQVAPLLAAGRLQTVLSDFEESPLPVHVVHSEGRNAAAKVRSFVDFAVAKLRANPLIN